MQQNWKFQRGDIFFTHFGASTGSEQHGDRPAVILQNDVGNYHSPTLIVATMTSKAEKKVNQPTHCLLENAGLNMPSVVQAEQIFTIDKSRALKYLGHLTPEEMRRVDDAVRISLALNPMGSIQQMEPIRRSTALYAPPEVVDGKPPVYPYTPIRSSFENAGSIEEMMLYTELQSAVHAMIQRVSHSSKLIYPREIYQRGVERKRVELIARDFNEYIVNEPKVSFRNGRYYVMDGQHTIEGCILLNGGEDRPILCKVYTGLTMEQEALLFAEQNGHAAPLSAGIKLRATVVGGDAPSKAFVAATNRAGLSLNYDSMQLSDYRIGCVGTALKLYDQLGEEIYCEALRHIVEAWEGKPDSFRAAVLRGVMYFVQLYHGQYSEERLVRALSGVHPMELYRVSRDNPAKLPGWRRYVYPIYTTYNGKCRKDALPMKF